jgi:hypothetical protein
VQTREEREARRQRFSSYPRLLILIASALTRTSLHCNSTHLRSCIVLMQRLPRPCASQQALWSTCGAVTCGCAVLFSGRTMARFATPLHSVRRTMMRRGVPRVRRRRPSQLRQRLSVRTCDSKTVAFNARTGLSLPTSHLL